MNGSVHLLRVSSRELDLVVPLFDLYRQFYGQRSDPEGARRFLSDRLNGEQSVVFAAVNSAAGEAVGFTQLYPTFSSISMRPAWILNDLYVREKHRGRGIGKLLLEAARRHAVETGANGLSLSTATDNAAAQKLYESFGFERDNGFYHYDLHT
jgi:ribosomal protein S18 acetylase RimI-like enzyme